MDMLASKYPKEDMEEAFEEIETLIKEESLFTEDIYKDYIIDFKKRKTVVKALCLHIAHDCNLPVAIVLQKKASITADVLS